LKAKFIAQSLALWKPCVCNLCIKSIQHQNWAWPHS